LLDVLREGCRLTAQSEDGGGGYRPMAPLFTDIAQDPAFSFGGTLRTEYVRLSLCELLALIVLFRAHAQGAAAPDPAADGALFDRRRIDVG
jgi:hypothetical protein